MLTEVGELSRAAEKLAAAPLWPVPDADLLDLLQSAQRVERSMAAVTAHVVREIDSRGVAPRATTRLLQSRLLLNRAAADRLVALAAGLQRYGDVDRMLSTGEIHTAHALTVIASLDVLRGDLSRQTRESTAGAGVMAQAETFLLEAAQQFTPGGLARLGDRILEHVAPDQADERDAAILRRQEARARPRRGLTLSPPFQGLIRVSGFLTVDDAAVVQAALDPLCAPAAADGRNPAQQRADALTDLCRLALRTTTLPGNGGEPPQITLTVQWDPLAHTIRGAGLDTGEALTAATARRIACDARITPIVLGGNSEILDAGRSRRLATGVLRRALLARDERCAFPGCDRPPRWCDAHHIRHWADGGPTDLDNLVLLCAHHHRTVHEGDWQIRLTPDHRPDFIPPRYLDQRQRPQRNLFHHRT